MRVLNAGAIFVAYPVLTARTLFVCQFNLIFCHILFTFCNSFGLLCCECLRIRSTSNRKTFLLVSRKSSDFSFCGGTRDVVICVNKGAIRLFRVDELEGELKCLHVWLYLLFLCTSNRQMWSKPIESIGVLMFVRSLCFCLSFAGWYAKFNVKVLQKKVKFCLGESCVASEIM